MSEQKNDFIDGADMTETITSKPVWTRGARRVSFENVWTDTPTGTFSWEGTNNRFAMDDPSDSRVTWTPVTAPTVVYGTGDPAGSASSNLVIFTDAELPLAVRQVYTPDGDDPGTGNLTTNLDVETR